MAALPSPPSSPSLPSPLPPPPQLPPPPVPSPSPPSRRSPRGSEDLLLGVRLPLLQRPLLSVPSRWALLDMSQAMSLLQKSSSRSGSEPDCTQACARSSISIAAETSSFGSSCAMAGEQVFFSFLKLEAENNPVWRDLDPDVVERSLVSAGLYSVEDLAFLRHVPLDRMLAMFPEDRQRDTAELVLACTKRFAPARDGIAESALVVARK